MLWDQQQENVLKDNPYNEDNKVQALNDIRKWWFNLGDTTEGRAKQLVLAKKHPQIYSLTIPGYTVTELGARILPQREGKNFIVKEMSFRTGTQDNSSQYADYLSEGLIEVRLPDEKVKHIIHENAAWVVDAVPVVYKRMAEILNEPEVQAAEAMAFGGRTAAEILSNADMREIYGISLVSSDVKNIEDISADFLKVVFTPEQLGPEVSNLIQEILQGTGYEDPINGFYSPIDIIPYLYAAQKAGKANPAYVFSSQNPDDQQLNKGLQLLTGLTKASIFWDEDEDGYEQLQFLTNFENRYGL